MPAVDPRIVRLFSESQLGMASLAAFVFYLLEQKGLIKYADVERELKAALDSLPEKYEGEVRYMALQGLNVLMHDPALDHALPFPWPPKRAARN